MGRGVLLAFLSSLLLIVPFPKFDLHFLAWTALVPLLVALKDKTLKSAFSLSFLTGLSLYVGVAYPLTEVNAFEGIYFILLGAYLASYVGLFGLGFTLISRKTNFPSFLSAPVMWVSTEYCRSNASFLGLPWALLGHSQYLNLPLIQISSFTGVYGVSFLIVMVNAALSEVILSWIGRKQPLALHWFKLFKPAIVPIILLGITLIYGFSVISVISERSDRENITVSVIQGNIRQDMRWEPGLRELNLQQHVRLSKEAADSSQASLIVWPETSVQGSLTQEPYLLNIFSTLAKETQSHLLIGVAVRPKFVSREFRMKDRFNSAFLVSRSAGVVGQYNKIHLLPFAEYLPYKDFFAWPSSFASMAGNFMPGREYTLFNLNDMKFGVTICWESIFPDLFRQFVKNGATFMVNISNDAWFGETAYSYQFMAINVFRAVENRVSIARSANTGISGFIDPYGRIIGKVKKGTKDIFVEGYLTMAIPVSKERTFYTSYGDIFVYMILLATISILVVALLKSSGK